MCTLSLTPLLPLSRVGAAAVPLPCWCSGGCEATGEGLGSQSSTDGPREGWEQEHPLTCPQPLASQQHLPRWPGALCRTPGLLRSFLHCKCLERHLPWVSYSYIGSVGTAAQSVSGTGDVSALWLFETMSIVMARLHSLLWSPACHVPVCRCQAGYYGDPVLGSGDHCRPCPCPDGPESGRQFASGCYQDPVTLQVTCVCSVGYIGTWWLRGAGLVGLNFLVRRGGVRAGCWMDCSTSASVLLVEAGSTWNVRGQHKLCR